MVKVQFFAWALVATVVSACDNASFKGTTDSILTKNRISSASDSKASVETTSVNVSFEDEATSGGLSLVSNAMSSYQALLEGGISCWGDLASTFTGSPTNVLRVRKNASGCRVVFKELRFKEGNTEFAFVNATGLEASLDSQGVFQYDASGSAPRQMTVKVAQSFVTSADSEIKLVAKMLNIQTTSVNVADESVSLSASSTVAAYPHVRVTKIGKFNGKIYATVACESSATESLQCNPAIAAGAGGSASAQPLSAMKAVVVKISGTEASGFPSSVSYSRAKALFDAGTSKSPTLPSTGHTAEFNELSFAAAGSGEKSLLIVRLEENVGGTIYESYKIFAVSGI